jgi:hypothetical protein
MVQYKNAAGRKQMLTLPLMGAHVKIRHSKIVAERCESGRIDMLGKHASWQRDRGFESHPLRQTDLACAGGLFFVRWLIVAAG